MYQSMPKLVQLLPQIFAVHEEDSSGVNTKANNENNIPIGLAHKDAMTAGTEVNGHNDNINIISLNIVLKNNWNSIVTENIKQFTQFYNAILRKPLIPNPEVPVYSLQDPVKKEAENSSLRTKILRSLVLNVYIKVLGPAIILVKSQELSMISSIKLLTGIDNIHVIYHQVFNLTSKTINEI